MSATDDGHPLFAAGYQAYWEAKLRISSKLRASWRLLLFGLLSLCIAAKTSFAEVRESSDRLVDIIYGEDSGTTAGLLSLLSFDPEL
jgi:hypothetical protein